jgi:hypothetical protein
LKKDVTFVWSDDYVKAFDNLKKSVTEYPILQQPDCIRKFILHCDASGYALGVILCQINASETNFLITECVISYASRLLKGAEVNYGITQKECLAIVWGIKQNGRLARWAMYLQEYTFDIVYRKGHQHTNVDAVSRTVLAAAVISNTKQEEDADNDKTLEAYDDSHLLCYLQFKKLMPGASKRQIKRVTKLNNN